MSRLPDERVALLPWGAHARALSGPPHRSTRGPRGERLCHLCTAPYSGGDWSVGTEAAECEGGPRCPRYYNFRRRNVVWIGGYWVPASLARQWETIDGAAACAQRARSPSQLALADTPREPLRTPAGGDAFSAGPPPPKPLLFPPAPASSRRQPVVLRVDFKPPPTAAQMAEYDAHAEPAPRAHWTDCHKCC